MNVTVLPWVLGWYLLLSIVTYAAYAFDKRRARSGGRRVPERTLHRLELLGGWPGALLARRRVHHKTRKRGFTAVLYAIALLHVGAWIGVALLA